MAYKRSKLSVFKCVQNLLSVVLAWLMLLAAWWHILWFVAHSYILLDHSSLPRLVLGHFLSKKTCMLKGNFFSC